MDLFVYPLVTFEPLIGLIETCGRNAIVCHLHRHAPEMSRTW